MTEGWRGWDDYAPFYDWENARTLQRRDVAFWQRLAAAQDGPVLELGCGTGRIAVPAAQAGARIVGIDRSEEMLARARRRVKRSRLSTRLSLVRGDIRALPFGGRTKFSAVLAAYGILQSLTRERDLQSTFESVARVLKRGGLFAIDVVPDLPKWDEYRDRISLTGRHGRHTTLTLVETVRQDRARRLTIFDQEYRARTGTERRVHRFSLTFRTLSVPQLTRRLDRAGFRVLSVLGDYQGGPWDPRADVWVILAKRR
jgi:ubiquinone/menaquinone biosynthesis C-methylase UbiE